jgi:NAD(P)-dependent dehydrogenase (short-subunit alcohol dehydrogenase family)
MDMALRLEGKVAIVTGAASPHSIGYATARRFAAEGAQVMLTDIRGDAVLEAALSIGASARAMGHDVADEASWRDVAATTLEAFGKIDILVNNAGLFLVRPIQQCTVEDFQRITGVNLLGTFLGVREVFGVMRRQATGGAIVNVSSIAGFVGTPDVSIYTATKGAVRTFTKAIALEGAPFGIRCNSVHPGGTDTDMIRSYVADQVNAGKADPHYNPMGRLGTPDEIANCILFLASDEASYVTGTELLADGGITAR